jgi:ribosome maturation protein Sdo1
MPKVVARTKVKGKHFEIEVDLDEALKVSRISKNFLGHEKRECC